LVRDPDVAAAPSWTNRETVVYAKHRVGGSGPTTLERAWTDGTRKPKTMDDEPGFPEGQSYFDPDWAEGGLLFTVSREFRSPGRIFVRPAGEGARQWGDARNAMYATWSPDGQAVAWLTSDGSGGSILWTGDGKKQVRGIEGDLEPPAWGSR
jgi:hypothetical protein